MASRSYLRSTLGFAVLVVLSLAVFVFVKTDRSGGHTVSLAVQGESSAPQDLVPIPFLSGKQSSTLQGSLIKVVEYTSGQGIAVYRVKFDDHTSEILKEKDGTKSNIFLVDTTGFSGAVLPFEPRLVLTAANADGTPTSTPEAIDVYGYRYSDAQSTAEKAASPTAPFNQRFPGAFFRSRRLFTGTNGATLDNFATTNGIKWFHMDTGPEITTVADTDLTKAVRFRPNTLTLLIISNNVKIDANPAPVCGNGFLQGTEQCDDGDATSGDGCSAACAIESSFTCAGSPSVCRRTPNLFVTQVTTASANVGSHQHIIGQRGAPVLSITLRTTNSPAMITQFFFTVEGTALTADAIEGLDLFLPGQSTPFLTAVPRTNTTTGRCPNTLATGTFCAAPILAGTGIIVTPAQPVTIVVQPVIRNDAAKAGKQFTVNLRATTVGATLANVSAITAFPIGGTSPLFFNNGNSSPEGEVFIGVPSTAPGANVQITGSAQHVVSAKVASLVNASTAASGSSLPIGSGKTIAAFALALTPQSTGAQFRPSTVLFDVQSNNTSLKGFTMTWDVDGSDVSTACTARDTATNTVLTDATGNYTVVCTLTSAAGSLVLSDGQTGTVTLKANTQTFTSSPVKVPKLRVLLSSFTNPAATQAGIGLDKSHFQYADLRNSTAAAFWMELPFTIVPSTQFVGPFCGNGLIEVPETCDDGNVTAGDGCSALCRTEGCGDGFLDANGGDNVVGSTDDEECDDGNTVNTDDCSNTCHSNIQLPLGR